MRSSTKLTMGLSLAVLAAALGLTGCGPDYALFKVHVTSDSNRREDIKVCKMAIQNEKGGYVVNELVLEKQADYNSAGELVLRQGCGDGLTKAEVGYFSYSTSRTSGELKFTVTALGGPDDQTVIQKGEGSAGVQSSSAEIPVQVPMKAVSP